MELSQLGTCDPLLYHCDNLFFALVPDYRGSDADPLLMANGFLRNPLIGQGVRADVAVLGAAMRAGLAQNWAIVPPLRQQTTFGLFLNSSFAPVASFSTFTSPTPGPPGPVAVVAV